MSDPAHPIVEAVLADPVVQAVLEDPSAKTQKAVSDAIDPVVRKGTPSPAPQAPVPQVGSTPTGGQAGQAGTVSPPKPNVIITPGGMATAAPTTTEEEDRSTVGQRRINLIWETTQSIVAITVTAATLYVSGRLALNEKADTAAFLLLSNVFFLVLGQYFQRTNHTKVGGVGKNEVGR